MMHFREQYAHVVSDGRDDRCSAKAARITSAGARQAAGESDIGILSAESHARGVL